MGSFNYFGNIIERDIILIKYLINFAKLYRKINLGNWKLEKSRSTHQRLNLISRDLKSMVTQILYNGKFKVKTDSCIMVGET